MLILLPGMDGTGALFDAFLKHVPEIETLVISYPQDECLDYAQLESVRF